MQVLRAREASDTDRPLEVLAGAWRSLGLRVADLEWELEEPALLREPLAARLRGSLGPALLAAGNRAVFAAVYEGFAPPPLWFAGWRAPRRPADRLRAELRCLSGLGREWAAIEAALSRMRFPGAAGSTVGARSLRLSWRGGPAPSPFGFGPPTVKEPELPHAGADCLIEAISPLQVVSRGAVLTRPPPLDVLVRSAGERLRQLCARWGDDGGLSRVVGEAVRQARPAALAWSRARVVRTERRSSRSGDCQWLSGLVGEWAYADVPYRALGLLAIATELGIGKDTAFGCGAIRLSVSG